MTRTNTLIILYALSVLSASVSYADPDFTEEIQENQKTWKVVAKISKIAISGAYGVSSGGDPYHAPHEDMENYTSHQSVHVIEKTMHTVNREKKGFSFVEATMRATEISIRSAYGINTGAGLTDSALEDIERHAPWQITSKRLLSDQEKLEELERETKALRSKLEIVEEDEKPTWWQRTKQTFTAVKETVGIVGAVLGIVIAIIALV